MLREGDLFLCDGHVIECLQGSTIKVQGLPEKEGYGC